MKTKQFFGLLFIALAIFSFSCKKNSDDVTTPDSYLKFKKNGTWITFKALGELGPDLGNASKTDFGVTAYSDDNSETFDLTIQINGTNFTTGVYDSDNLNYITYVSYMKTIAGDLDYFEIDQAPGRPSPSRYLINVTSITATELRGTFTGNYLYNDFGNGTSADIVDITEGEFKVKRIR